MITSLDCYRFYKRVVFLQKNNPFIMRKRLLFIALLGSAFLQAQTAIFNPTMTVSSFNIINAPAAEGVDKIIDGDANTKLLDFDEVDGTGFTVDLGGASNIATSIEITTANDAEGRDPQDYEVLGSNDGVVFTSIATGVIPCISTRFFARTFIFSNSTAYSYYRVNFTDNECNSGEGIIQVAEVQLYEQILGIAEDLLLKNQISIYPNSNNGVFTLGYTGKQTLTEAKIFSSSGKLVQIIDLKYFNNNLEIKLQNIGSGVYFAQILTNNSAIVKKIIVN